MFMGLFLLNLIFLSKDFLYSQEKPLYTENFTISKVANHGTIKTVFILSDIKTNSLTIFEETLLMSNLNLVDRSKILNIIDEQTLELAGLSETSKAIKAGRLAGADAYFDFNYSFFLFDLSIKIKLISVTTGEVLLLYKIDFDETRNIDVDKILYKRFTYMLNRYKKYISFYKEGK